MVQITLRVLDGADRGKVYTNLNTPVTIGREEGNSVQLNDERISRFHLKIQDDQDKLVLTDLESTNGTKVNGEDIQLRILRYGDIIHLGRSVLLFGSREEIAKRLATLREADGLNGGTIAANKPDAAHKDGAQPPNLEYELNWTDDPDAAMTFRALEPPELPQRLSPGQAAQLSELLEYLHIRLRDLLASVHVAEQKEGDRITLDLRQWQNLLDLKSRLAAYMREVGNPPEEE